MPPNSRVRVGNSHARVHPAWALYSLIDTVLSHKSFIELRHQTAGRRTGAIHTVAVPAPCLPECGRGSRQDPFIMPEIVQSLGLRKILCSGPLLNVRSRHYSPLIGTTDLQEREKNPPPPIHRSPVPPRVRHVFLSSSISRPPVFGQHHRRGVSRVGYRHNALRTHPLPNVQILHTLSIGSAGIEVLYHTRAML
ncbi:hypothetical protein BC628DRAFT_428426 [Trametes gibbosa]|nr:hypothetical protein BC628DRAFT_428426 [Trametes gibbosa]